MAEQKQNYDPKKGGKFAPTTKAPPPQAHKWATTTRIRRSSDPAEAEFDHRYSAHHRRSDSRHPVQPGLPGWPDPRALTNSPHKVRPEPHCGARDCWAASLRPKLVADVLQEIVGVADDVGLIHRQDRVAERAASRGQESMSEHRDHPRNTFQAIARRSQSVFHAGWPSPPPVVPKLVPLHMEQHPVDRQL